MLSALETRYSTIKWKNGYNLYDDNRKAKYQNGGAFVAHIEIDNGKYLYQGQKYNNVEDLTNAIESYIATLPFNPELYDPIYKKSYFMMLCCKDYLYQLGFTKVKDYSVDIETYEYKNPLLNNTLFKLQIAFDGNGQTTGKVYQNINDFKWIEISFKDLESAIGAINSMITQNVFITASESVRVLSTINNMRISESINMVEVDSSLNIATTDMKEQLISLLEKELAILKQTN